MGKKLLVILDNGHGSNTPGKCSPDKSLMEWTWTREITQLINKKLTEQGIESVILVPETKDVALSTRVNRANKIYDANGKNKKDKMVVLISVHINAAGNDAKWHNATGWSGWISPTASTNSKLLAQHLYAACEERKLQGNRYVPKEKYWTAAYYIVKNTKMPAVLTENLFMDSKTDAAYLLSTEGKEAIADLHVDGLKKFIANIK